jgi:hypothetical protein
MKMIFKASALIFLFALVHAREPRYENKGPSKTFYQYDKGILDLQKATLPLLRGLGPSATLECSGFLIEKGASTYFVTARHCIDSIDDSVLHWPLSIGKDSVAYQNVRDFRVRNKLSWGAYKEKEIDIAAIAFLSDVKRYGINPIPYSKISDDTVLSELDEVFYIPFQGIDGKLFQLYRSGGISYQFNQRQFLIDGYSIPGYSGCPIFLKPSLVRSQAKGAFLGFDDPDGFNLIGIMSGQILNYQNSQITKGVIVEHNAGLAVVTVGKYVKRVIDISENQLQSKR